VTQSRCNDSAKPRPIPVPPPVTKTVLPVICMAFSSRRYQYLHTRDSGRAARQLANRVGALN
jgi:hypothetical protein